MSVLFICRNILLLTLANSSTTWHYHLLASSASLHMGPETYSQSRGSTPLRVLLALLLQRPPIKNKRGLPIVQQVEGDGLALKPAGSGQVAASIERAFVSQHPDVD